MCVCFQFGYTCSGLEGTISQKYFQKRPIIWQKRPIHMAKEAYHMAKEAYHMAKEAYHSTISPLFSQIDIRLIAAVLLITFTENRRESPLGFFRVLVLQRHICFYQPKKTDKKGVGV